MRSVPTVVATLLPDLKSFGPSYVLAVPRVLEKIYNAADAKAGGGLKLRTFRWATKVAIMENIYRKYLIYKK